MIKNYYAFFQINCGLPTVFNFLVRWTCPAYWVDFSTVTSGLPLAEYSIYLARYCMLIRKENHIVVTLFSFRIVLSNTLVVP